jgi:hypothetical protein
MVFTILRTPASRSIELDAARVEAIAHINHVIGVRRLGMITVIPGQEMIYNAKEAEAKAFLALKPAPTDMTDYPFLEAEIGITAPTATDLANLWVVLSGQWKAIGSQLEQLRLGTVGDINTATDVAGVQTILSDFDTTLETV